MIVERIIAAILEHFDISKEQVDNAKEIIDMVEFKEVNGKRVAYITVGEGLEVKIVQPNKKSRSQGAPSNRESEALDDLLGKRGTSRRNR